ncbi:helix-turn-helix transcriptional regulator [Solwaraspora sp. WMMA2056]|uniref:helix-turn-helix domain-containing protein n=1 Tax=Solwaraspora sp. WMMA2056 TaxID=3015161 RepID=UPI00259B6823|nr:helix-turn-helix transcriptional regulator [Solwaraspora sp. WMMA2056]WJK39364.1 helix-turn-helix transcriptional regulator [Solwaraspora sp. WMMA2056]
MLERSISLEAWFTTDSVVPDHPYPLGWSRPGCTSVDFHPGLFPAVGGRWIRPLPDDGTPVDRPFGVIIVNDLPSLPARLRELRTSRKMAQDRLAAAIGVSKSLVQQFESGKLVPQEGTAERLDGFFGTGNEIQRAAKDAREDRQPWLRSWFDQERRATLLRSWAPMLVPGLLQCESYMREVFSAVPSNAGKVDALVAKRRERQAATIDRDDPVGLSAIIGEVVLRRGPSEVLMDQLGHLVDVGHRPHVRIRVIPAESEGIHVGLSGAFVIANLPDGRRSGHLDDQLTGHAPTTRGDLGHLELAWEEIDALALPVVQSRDLILRTLNEHR